MEDMDRLIAEAKKREMYILMDLVVNHCSDEHEWFQQAIKDPDGKYGNFFYIRLLLVEYMEILFIRMSRKLFPYRTTEIASPVAGSFIILFVPDMTLQIIMRLIRGLGPWRIWIV